MRWPTIVTLLVMSVAIATASDPLHLKLLSSAVAKGAVCLDGYTSCALIPLSHLLVFSVTLICCATIRTAPGYYFRAGSGTGVNKWVIHHQVINLPAIHT
jgi:hypothetical protein